MEWKSNLKDKLLSWKEALHQLSILEGESSQLVNLMTDVEEPITVMILGEFNAGKSTFINAFLGEELLISDVIATTAVVTKIKYGENLRLIGHFPDGTSKEFQVQSLAGLSAELEEDLTIRRQLHYLELQLPNDKLRDLTLIDSPGLNAGNDFHTNATMEFMNRTDYGIWLFDYRNVGTKSEIRELNKLREYGIETFGVINGLDLHDEEEESIEDFVEFNRRRFPGLVKTLIPISAYEALKGQTENNPELLEWSNWQEIEKLFSRIQNNSGEKERRIFSRLLVHLKTVHDFIGNEKAKTPILFYKHMIDEFLEKTFPTSSRHYQQILTEREQIEDTLSQIHRLYQQPADEPDRISNLLQSFYQYQLAPADELDQWSNEWHDSCLPAYQNYLSQLYLVKREQADLLNQREDISRRRTELHDRKFFKKGKLKRLAHDQLLFNERIDDSNRQHRSLVQQEDDIKKQFQQFFQKITNHTAAVQTKLLDDAGKQELQWETEWNTGYHVISKISEDKLEKAAEVRLINSQYSESIGAFFRTIQPELDHIEAYQEAKYQSENIDTLVPHLSVDAFNRTKSEFLAMRQFKPITHTDIRYGQLDPLAFFNDSIPAIPLSLNFPFDREIGLISKKRKQTLGGIVAALVIGLAASQINFSAIADVFAPEDDYETADEYNDGEEYWEDAVVETQTVEEAEPAPNFLEWDSQMIANYLYALHEKVNSAHYDEVAATFTAHAWYTYNNFYNLNTVQFNSIDELTITEQSEYEITFETVESLTIDGEPSSSKHLYILNFLEEHGVMIVGFDGEHIQQEVFVDEERLSQFILDFRRYYMSALNQDGFSSISHYFMPGSAAYHEINDYITRMSGQDYYFDFQTDSVLSLTRTAPNYYEVHTEEQLLFTDDKGAQTIYNKEKVYTIFLPEENVFQIESIITLSTETEEIIQETVSSVSTDQVAMFMENYYRDFVAAFNGQGFSSIEAYYDPDGPQFAKEQAYLQNALEKNMAMNNMQMVVQSVEPYDDQHYLASIYTEDEYFYQDGTGDFKQIQANYLVKAGPEGQLTITDIPSLQILNEEEY